MTAFLPNATFYLHNASPDLVAEVLQRAGTVKQVAAHQPLTWSTWECRSMADAPLLSFEILRWKPPLSSEAQIDLTSDVLDTYFALERALGKHPSLVVHATLHREIDSAHALLPIAVALLNRFDGLMHYIPEARDAWSYFDPSRVCYSGDLRAGWETAARILGT